MVYGYGAAVVAGFLLTAMPAFTHGPRSSPLELGAGFAEPSLRGVDRAVGQQDERFAGAAAHRPRVSRHQLARKGHVDAVDRNSAPGRGRRSRDPGKNRRTGERA